jgi:AcrR family transcriptional regulator
MTFSEELVARAVEPRRTRANEEIRALVEAGLAVLRREGAAGLTVGEVLRVAGLSTRAFYRHFRSKDELVLAIYERESDAAQARLRERVATATSPHAALVVWVDETLALAYDPRRARRTRVLLAEGRRLEADHPREFAAIVDGVVAPLAAVLRAHGSPEPERDARTVHAVTWSLVAERLAGGTLPLDAARAHVLRFVAPALGAGA